MQWKSLLIKHQAMIMNLLIMRHAVIAQSV
jgi:hypothetical protein